MQWFKPLLLATGIAAVSVAAQAKQTMCVFDIVGKSGDVYALMKDYQLAAKTWGADIELKVGTNEAVIAEDFKAGKYSRGKPEERGLREKGILMSRE